MTGDMPDLRALAKELGRPLGTPRVLGSLSNFGMIGGRFASLVVVPPQVAIIGAGRAEQRVVVDQGQQVIRRMLPLSLTFDHRVVTGGEAARFLAALKSALTQP